ncbi:hypothetical protein NQD34_013270, partial [Periophthalmus magnuspinnatus]
VSHVHDGWRRDHNNLENPEADVGEGGKGVIANVVTARLFGVAGEFGLFIGIYRLATHCSQDYTKDYQHGKPDLPHKGGVVVDFFQETSEETPAH